MTFPGDNNSAQPAGRAIPQAANAMLDEAEAAQLLDLPVLELQRLRNRGEGPPWLKLSGGRAGYTRALLSRFAAARGGPAEPPTVIGRRRR